MQKEDALLPYLSTTHIDIRPHPPDAPRYQWILPRAKKCSPDTFCTSLWTGAALSNPLGGKKADTRMGICFFGDPPGIRLHFRLWRKLRFGSVKPSPAALIRAALNYSNPRLSCKKRKMPMHLPLFGDPPGIRTPDPLLKRQLLCQLS